MLSYSEYVARRCRRTIYAVAGSMVAHPEAAQRVEPGARSGELLGFELAGQSYAIPVEDVREVLPRATLTPVPGAPAGLAGVLRVRGSFLPVVDLRIRLGLPPSPPRVSDRILVISRGALTVGWLVDDVRGLLPGRAIVAPRADDDSDAVVAGVLHDANRVASVLNSSAVIGTRIAAFVGPLLGLGPGEEGRVLGGGSGQ